MVGVLVALSYLVSTGEFTTHPADPLNIFLVSKQGYWNAQFRISLSFGM